MPGAKLVLLAQTRAGYGNLSQLVTLGRRQAVKGSYRWRAPTSRRMPSGSMMCSPCCCRCATGANRSMPRVSSVKRAGWRAETRCQLDRLRADCAATTMPRNSTGCSRSATDGNAAGRRRRRADACAAPQAAARRADRDAREDAAGAMRHANSRPTRSDICGRCTGSRASTPPNCCCRRRRSPSAARSRSTSCATSTRKRSCRRARHRPAGCGG